MSINSQRKKDSLIDQISQRIYQKHEKLISFKKVQEFTKHLLKDKQRIEGSDLTKIENKIHMALKEGAVAAKPKDRFMSSQDRSKTVQSGYINNQSPKLSNPVEKKLTREITVSGLEMLPSITGSTNLQRAKSHINEGVNFSSNNVRKEMRVADDYE